MKEQIRPEVFRNAARLLSEVEGIGCCMALAASCSCTSDVAFFRSLFLTRRRRGYWWGYPEPDDTRKKNARIIALLLAEIIAKEGLE